ncbi:MAG: chemotaxis response regulator protein-glutamate methylesterase [Coriobacteriia bacterium]|nr:chemotaxis response regulator protein-glutamate methylesterase [Coriobacteriia bacterium]
MSRIIRVLVVDDSALIRQMLTRALAMDPRVEIVGTAKTGVEAIERARELRPDVVTLDIEMPELSGLEALPHIRKHTDARVVVLSSLDDPDTTYRALAKGAIDFIAKPSTGVASSITELSERLLKVIKTAHRVLPERIAASLHDAAEPAGRPGADYSNAPQSRIAACVAIAASTGGPPALERVFAGLAASLPASYLVVQHLPAGFATSLARRLSQAGEIEVVEAADGDSLEPARALLAPYGSHMVIEQNGTNRCVRLIDDEPIHGVRPAGDVTLKSVARTFGNRSVGVVLTGMGADGAEGAKAIKLAGGDIVVQDEQTSVVWGMPRAAINAGAATRVVPVGLIAAEIRRAIRSRADRRAAE